MAFYLLNLKCRHKRTSSPIFSCSKILRMNQFKLLADFVNLYLQEVLIELSKVGKLALVRAGEQALDLTLTTKKLATNQPIDEVKEQVNEKYSS